jgi:hypothetical protein
MADSRNDSGKAIYGNANPPYDLWEGDGAPDVPGYLLVAAPGGTVPADYVARYGLEGKLDAPEGREAALPTNWDGEPLVTLDSGRAVAASVAPPHLREETLKRHRAQQERQAGKAARPGDAEGKAVSQSTTENKSGATAAAPAAADAGKEGKPAPGPSLTFGKGDGGKGK